LTIHIITNQKVSFRYWKREFVVCGHGTCTINERQNPTEHARETKIVYARETKIEYALETKK
jgi:hypothetical protein